MAISLTMDCNDRDRQAKFWCGALGYSVGERAGVYVALVPEGPGPMIFLQQVPESKAAKNRLHMDWEVADMDAEAARLVALGATRGDRFEEHGVAWITMRDPEGNEFCVEQALPVAL